MVEFAKRFRDLGATRFLEMKYIDRSTARGLPASLADGERPGWDKLGCDKPRCDKLRYARLRVSETI